MMKTAATAAGNTLDALPGERTWCCYTRTSEIAGSFICIGQYEYLFVFIFIYTIQIIYIYMYIYTQFTLNKYIWRETDLFYDAHKPSFCFYLFLAIEQSIEQWKLTIFYIGLSSTKQDWMCHCLNVHLRLYWVFQKRFGDDDLRPGQISTTFGSKIHSLERPRFWKWVMPYGSEVLLDFLFFKSKF